MLEKSDNVKQFFLTLFDKEDAISYGNKYSNKIFPLPTESGPEFFSINSIDHKRDHGFVMKESYDEFVPRRADLNVSKFRNFMFEMDGVPLEDQLKIFDASDIPFTSIVYSGGKSYHAILSLEVPLEVEPYNFEAVRVYKNIWKRLAARIDMKGRQAGFEFPDGKTFVDQSSKNPSRLSRFPFSVRPDKDKEQRLIYLGQRMPAEEFEHFICNCPEVLESVQFKAQDRPEVEINSKSVFFDVCPIGLKRSILNVDWGSHAGMYPEIYRLTLWAIDATNVCKDTWLEIMYETVFRALVENHNYPRHKLEVGVDHAYDACRRI